MDHREFFLKNKHNRLGFLNSAHGQSAIIAILLFPLYLSDLEYYGCSHQEIQRIFHNIYEGTSCMSFF